MNTEPFSCDWMMHVVLGSMRVMLGFQRGKICVVFVPLFCKYTACFLEYLPHDTDICLMACHYAIMVNYGL